jgi:trehalose 6-phosphate phosphatase
MGHYGLERWDASNGELRTVEPPPGLASARDELPGLLESLGLGDAAVEDKGLSVAVHVRGLADGDSALESLREPLAELAERSGLVAEPGKRVIELRPPGMHKGEALHQLVDEFPARAVAFVGDDLGDLAAFDEVDRLRSGGVPGLLVCSGSAEESALVERADIVVDGPPGVVAFISDLVRQLRTSG